MRKLIVACLFLFPLVGLSQKNMILYNMSHVPQSIYSNPALVPTSRINIALPALGAVNLSASRNNFETKNVFDEENGESTFNVRKFVDGLEDENFIQSSVTLDLIHIGFASGQNYFHFNISERLNIETQFPKDAAILIDEVWSADDIEDFLGRNIVISDLLVNQYHVRELGFGWARKINNKLSVGAKYKLLYGVSSVETKSSTLVLDTDIQNEEDTLSGFASFDVNSSGVNDYWEENYGNLVSANRNFGHSIDIGVQYKPNELLEFSGAAIGLFSNVEWKNNVRNYRTNGVGVEISPVSFESIINREDTNIYQAIENFVDSLGEQLNIDPTFEPYSTDIPTRINLFAGYNIMPKLQVGLLSQNLFYKGESRFYLKGQLNAQLKRFLQAQISYAILDEDEAVTNIGLGLSVNAGPVQFYVMSENVLAPIYYHDNLNPTVMFGFNLTFVRDHQY